MSNLGSEAFEVSVVSTMRGAGRVSLRLLRFFFLGFSSGVELRLVLIICIWLEHWLRLREMQAVGFDFDRFDRFDRFERADSWTST